jgi:EmrB/QacA subfamily drug resistance transporter
MSTADKNRLIIALSLAMFLAAVEGTIVTLAIPTIVRDLEGFDLISHVFSVYLLTGAIATPVYCKLSDLNGRRRTLLVGIVVFLLGSALCGLAQNMVMLIVFRALQGIGAGAIYTVPMIIVGDVFPLRERGKIQGSLSMVWGIAALFGPFLGGLLIDLLSWHWIFFINVPFGALALLMLQTSFREDARHNRRPIDYPGILTLSAAMLAFLSIFLFESDGGTLFGLRNLLLLVATAVLLFVFFHIERRAPEPLVPLGVLTKSSFFVNVISMLFMATLIGVDVYTPIYLQNIKGFSPLIAGLVLLPMSVSWMLVSIPLGRLIAKLGGKPVNAVGTALALLGMIPVLFFARDTSLIFILAVVFFLGIGFGITMTTQTMIIQDSVGFEKRGAAVAVNSLVRNLGQTVGISVFGAVFNMSIIRGFDAEGIIKYDLGNLYDIASYQVGVTWDQIVFVLTDSIHVVYGVLIAIAVLCVAFSLIMPRPTSVTRLASSEEVAPKTRED